MRTNIVFTLTGADRVGIVDEVTQLLFNLGGNVETSRMARLGGEFAILMLIALPSEQLANLDKNVQRLVGQGYKVTTIQTELTYAETHAGWRPYQIHVQGADHEGLIHEIAHTLSQCGISIEAMETGTVRAANSGIVLFTMTAEVIVPPDLPGQTWSAALEDVAHRLQLDMKLQAIPTH